MPLAEATPNQQWMANTFMEGGQDPNIGDDKLLIRFEARPVEDSAETKAHGRPIYKEMLFVEIRVPGDRDNIILRPITPKDKVRFAKRLEAWEKANRAEVQDGTPLTEWPPMPKTTALEMRFFGIFTVEQLANVNDTNVKKWRDLFAWRQKAKDWLDIAENGAAASKLRAEKEAADNRAQALQRSVEEQALLLQQLTAKLETLQKQMAR